jgi:GNAT superfamily N-acetyltransferase
MHGDPASLADDLQRVSDDLAILAGDPEPLDRDQNTVIDDRETRTGDRKTLAADPGSLIDDPETLIGGRKTLIRGLKTRTDDPRTVIDDLKPLGSHPDLTPKNRHGRCQAHFSDPRRDHGAVLRLSPAFAMPHDLTLHDFRDDLAHHFHDINAEWIEAMFRLEDTDREVLQNPRERIVEPGGVILFVEAAGLGIVGTCALQKTGANSYELTKMGVCASARGMKAGEFLLAAVIEHAVSLGADPLYLLTNAKCAPAIHLYEKLGFRHDAGIMAAYGARYERCDVAMRYVPSTIRRDSSRAR